jgi:hypothetical protein
MHTRKNPKVMLLLALLVGAAGWNFHQNTQADEATLRPFRAYSDADLEQLISQYQGVNVAGGRVQQVSGASAGSQNVSLLGAQVSEFERVQKISEQRRAVADQAFDRQTSLEQLQYEQGKRQADRPIYKMIFRRLFTFENV